MAKRRRAIYLSLRFGMLAVALGAVAFRMPRVAHTLRADDAAALAVWLVLFVAPLHQAGDRCLRAVGKATAANIRHVDRAGRIGGAVAAISDTVDSLLARADRALYQAKARGRNRVVEIGA